MIKFAQQAGSMSIPAPGTAAVKSQQSGNGGGGGQARPRFNDATRAAIRNMQSWCLKFGDFISMLILNSKASKDNNELGIKLRSQYTQFFTSQKGFSGADLDANWSRQTQKALSEINRALSDSAINTAGFDERVKAEAPTNAEDPESVTKRAEDNAIVIMKALAALDPNAHSYLGNNFQHIVAVDRLPGTIVSDSLDEVPQSNILLTLRHLESMLILKAFLRRKGFAIARSTDKNNNRNNQKLVDQENSTSSKPQPLETTPATQVKLQSAKIIDLINKIAKPPTVVTDVPRDRMISRTKTPDEVRRENEEFAQPGNSEIKEIGNNKPAQFNNRALQNASWTYGQWESLLEYLIKRAEHQWQIAKDELNNLADLDDNSADKIKAYTKETLKSQYRTNVQNLLSMLSQLKQHYNAASNTILDDNILSGSIDSDGNAVDSFGRKIKRRPRPLTNGPGTGMGSNVYQTMEQYAQAPFIAPNRDPDTLYIHELLSAFRIPENAFPLLFQGPAVIDTRYLISRNIDIAKEALLGTVNDVVGYIHELQSALRAIYNIFKKDKDPEVIRIQTQVYQPIMTGLSAMTSQHPLQARNNPGPGVDNGSNSGVGNMANRVLNNPNGTAQIGVR